MMQKCFCTSIESCLRGLQTVPWTSWLGVCTINCGTLYRQGRGALETTPADIGRWQGTPWTGRQVHINEVLIQNENHTKDLS